MGLISSPESKMYADWTNYFDTSKSGDSKNWAGGTLTRNEGDTATYTDSFGKKTVIGKSDPNWQALASGNSGIAAEWAANYGYKPLPEAPKMVQAKPVAAASAGSASAAQWKPTNDALVEKRIGGLIDNPNSVLNVQAKTAADRESASRGLLNSSMALSAAQDAAYKSAIPIATADANTFARSLSENAQMATQASIANANNSTQASIASMNEAGNMSRFNAGWENDILKTGYTGQLDLVRQNTADNAAMDRTKLTEEGANTRNQATIDAADKRTDKQITADDARTDKTIAADDKRSNQTQINTINTKLTELTSSTDATIREIMSDPNKTDATKRAEVSQVIKTAKAMQAQYLGQLAVLNYTPSSIFNFDDFAPTSAAIGDANPDDKGGNDGWPPRLDGSPSGGRGGGYQYDVRDYATGDNGSYG